MIKYKGFLGFFTFDEKTNLFHGKVSNTHYLITFQGKSIEKIRHAFQDAVDEYIAWCEKHGKELEKHPTTD